MIEKLPVSLPLLCALGGALVLLVVLLFVGQVPIGYNVRNLAVRWRITFLTALAFTLVVGLLTIMLAFVNGMYRLTEGSGQPGNVIILSDGATDELFSNLAFGDATDVLNKISPTLRPSLERDPAGRVLLSKEVYLVANQPMPVVGNEQPRRRFIQIRGLEDAVMASRVHAMELLNGAWFSAAGVEELPDTADKKGSGKQNAIQVVFGEGIARELAKDKNKERLEVGDFFELGPTQEAGDTSARKWIVVGIMKSAGSTFASEIWAKQDVVGKMFGKDNYTSLILRTRDGESAAAVGQDIRDNAKLKAVPETEYYASLSETNKQFLGAILFVAIVMAVGGIFGVMNTMFAAISQRTKDIGVLRILGFTRWQLLVSFFLESLAIALLGGLLGCALGYLADGRTATSIVSGGQGGGKTVILKMAVDANVLAAGVLFTLVMGALGGLLPAISAMRLKPLESLR
jgi:ABC-type antimicrobial peptide transport system permease subunit